MPLIHTVSPESASGDIAQLYTLIQQSGRTVGNNAQLFSCSPEILRQQLSFIGYYSNHPSLSLPLLASIRIVVSHAEECDYCVDYNSAMLINQAGWSVEEVNILKTDPTASRLSAKEESMVMFVRKGVRNAHGINADDLDTLRELGWTDRDIFDALNHGARMVSTDILLNAFKVDAYHG